MRKLATIRTISELLPIEGKDLIELAIIDGWSVIVKKDEFKVGGLCVYCEIDSVMPARPEFEFLRKKDYRIKTMKMAGVVSQGICFSPSVFNWEEDDGHIIVPDSRGYFTSPNSKLLSIGDDVTYLLGITQYTQTMDVDPIEKPAIPIKYPKFLMRFKWFRNLVYKKNHREDKGFPKFISKTNETRIENLPHLLLDKTKKWICTEKLDGCSATYALVKRRTWYGMPKYEFIVCSRNLRLWKKDKSQYWAIAESIKMEQVLRNLIGNTKWIAIQGEIIGPGIQSNKYKKDKYEFYAYNLITPTMRTNSLVGKSILYHQKINWVPILSEGMTLPDTISDMHNFVDRQSILYPTLAEGCVFRSLDGNQSFKSVSPKFLMKHDE